MTDKRKDCLMRHENGNCNVIGGFCTAVNDPICAGLHNAYDCGYCDGETRAKRQQEHPQWISVKDRLPGRYATVLITISTVNGYGDPAKLVTIGGYDHSEKRWEQYTSTDRQLCQGEAVTHWMPLPDTAVNDASEKLLAGTYTPKMNEAQVRNQLRQLDPLLSEDVEIKVRYA